MKLSTILAASALCAMSPTHAQTPASPMADGVVESVDPARGVVTLKHGDIVSIQMPAMTMTFSVADKKVLGPVKPGDKVRFRVEMLNNAPTITHIQPAR